MHTIERHLPCKFAKHRTVLYMYYPCVRSVVVGNKLIHSGTRLGGLNGGKYYDCDVCTLCCPRRLMRRTEEDFAAEYYMHVMRM